MRIIKCKRGYGNQNRAKAVPCDRSEEEMVAQFVATECSCTKRCSSSYSKGKGIHAHCCDLSHNELDMVLLGKLIATTNTSSQVVWESRQLEERESIYNIPSC